MPKTRPLRAHVGPSPVVLKEMNDLLPPGETFQLPPTPWASPISRQLKRRWQGSERAACRYQQEVFLGLTNDALYQAVLDDSGTKVVNNYRTGLSGISSVGVLDATRRIFVNELDPRRMSEQILVLYYTYNGGRAEYETPFSQGAELVRVLQRSAGESAASLGGAAEQLAKLHELVEKGALSPEEWDRAKQLFLGKEPSRQSQALVLLAQLHSLFQAGALDESEFKIKKWDLLAKQ